MTYRGNLDSNIVKGGGGHTRITRKAYNGPKLRGEMVKLDEVTECER